MSEPRRIQLSRKKGWRMPENTVKVDRTTPHGNPFRQEDLTWIAVGMGFTGDKKGRIACSVELFRRWRGLEHRDGPLIGSGMEGFAINVHVLMSVDVIPVPPIPDLDDLRGKNLACWCKPGEPCHADVLLELANSLTSPVSAS